MLTNENPQYLLQRSIILLTIIIFAFYVLYDLNFLNLILVSDKSKISMVILTIYLVATMHWMYVARNLDSEMKGGGKVSDFFKISETKTSAKEKDRLYSSCAFHV